MAGFGSTINLPPIPGQTFRTIPVVPLQPALYMLAIRPANSPSFTFTAAYVFPLSPANLRKEFMALTNFYDTFGASVPTGVARLVDEYGQTPPIFTIEGTTGWQRHMTDGFLLTGLQSMQQLEKFFALFAVMNQQQMQVNSPDLFVMEFFDFFNNDFWEIVPIGLQGVYQSRDRPLLRNYRFRFAAVKPVSFPLPAPFDGVLAALAAPAITAQSLLSNGIGSTLGNYTPNGGLY